MADKELLQQALARVAAQADGNGVAASEVALAGGSMHWHEFQRLVRCVVTVKQTSSTYAGPSAEEPCTTCRDAAEVDTAAERYVAAVVSGGQVTAAALEELRSRDDLGFDATKTPHRVKSTVRHFACRRTCGTCGGTCTVACKDCGGHGLIACYRCIGGKVNCNSCLGTGRITRYDSTKQAQVTAICYGCSGTGRINCGNCGGTNRVRCGTCGGSGSAVCSACSGQGFFTDVVTVAGVADLHGEARWGQVPADAVSVLRKFNVSQLIYGHARVRAAPDESIDDTSARLCFAVSVPVGSLTARIKGEDFSFDVVGTQSLPIARGPFIERLTEGGNRLLERTAGGRIGAAGRRLADAATFDVVRCAVASCFAGRFYATTQFRKSYPSVPEAQAGEWVKLAQKAVDKVLRATIRKRRRRWYVLSFLALLFWFVFGSRQEVVADRTVFSVFDVLVPVGLLLFGWLWIRFRLTGDMKRLWFRYRNDRDKKWREHKRLRPQARRPGVGIVWMLLALLILLPIMIEAGWGMRGTHAKAWAEVRAPWAPHLDPTWQRVRKWMDETTRPRREPTRDV